jgi:hypothetical protein
MGDGGEGGRKASNGSGKQLAGSKVLMEGCQWR